MSATMTSNQTLSMLAEAICRYHIAGFNSFGFVFPTRLYFEISLLAKTPRFAEKDVVKVLAKLNMDAINERYPKGYPCDLEPVEYLKGCDIWEPVLFDADGYTVQPWHYKLLKSLQCYIYQCCEGSCDTTPLYGALKELEFNLMQFICSNNNLYRNLPWA